MTAMDETGARASGRGDDEDEISLIDLFAVLLKRKWMIIGVTAAGAVAAVALSVASLLLPPERNFMPNEYSPTALMMINNSDSSGGLASALSSSGLGSIASLAGVSVGGGQTYSALAIYLVGTNTLLDAVVDEFGLIERWEIKEHVRAASREALKKKLTAEFDDESGVFSIAFTDWDPEFARRVVDYCVDYLDRWFEDLGLDKTVRQKANLEQNIQNTYDEIRRLEEESRRLERSVDAARNMADLPAIRLDIERIAMELTAQKQVYAQLKVQLELTKVTLASEAPIFQVLERAEVPDQKSKPSRGMLCVIVTFAAGFLAVFLAFVLNAVENVRRDPEAMGKLGIRPRA